MILIISLSFKILGDLRISADLSGSDISSSVSRENLKTAMFMHLKTIVGDTLVDDSLINEKGGLDEISEDWEVADNGLQRIHSFSPLGQ